MQSAPSFISTKRSGGPSVRSAWFDGPHPGSGTIHPRCRWLCAPPPKKPDHVSRSSLRLKRGYRANRSSSALGLFATRGSATTRSPDAYGITRPASRHHLPPPTSGWLPTPSRAGRRSLSRRRGRSVPMQVKTITVSTSRLEPPKASTPARAEAGVRRPRGPVGRGEQRHDRGARLCLVHPSPCGKQAGPRPS